LKKFDIAGSIKLGVSILTLVVLVWTALLIGNQLGELRRSTGLTFQPLLEVTQNLNNVEFFLSEPTGNDSAQGIPVASVPYRSDVWNGYPYVTVHGKQNVIRSNVGKLPARIASAYYSLLWETEWVAAHPGGHLNFPHLWPGQNPPPDRRRDGGMLGLCRPPGNTICGLFQPPALSLELEQVAVVHQAVEQRGDDDHVAEQLRPVLDHAV